MCWIVLHTCAFAYVVQDCWMCCKFFRIHRIRIRVLILWYHFVSDLQKTRSAIQISNFYQTVEYNDKFSLSMLLQTKWLLLIFKKINLDI